MRTALVTGAAGFIGYHLTAQLLQQGWRVVGVDNLNDYYDPALKQARLQELEKLQGDFQFFQRDIADQQGLYELFDRFNFERVFHLAAQAGVRYSLKKPDAYVHSNLVGFANVLEACRHAETPHLLYASSSSVYGLNTSTPFSEQDRTDAPISLYAATKKSNELMAFTYSHLYDLPATGMRFFTVYGPWGRPDMAYWTFTEKIEKGEPLPIFGKGKPKRDFTFVDDIIQAVLLLSEHVPEEKPAPGSQARARHEVYNLGNHRPVSLLHFVEVLERLLGKKAQKQMLPMQPGDVLETYADVEKLCKLGWKANTEIDEGLEGFVGWWKDYKYKGVL